MHATRVTAFVLAAGVAVAGCGDDSEPSGGAQTEARTAETAPNGKAASRVSISATEFKFDPANPQVKAGTVEFKLTNDGQAPHALEVEGPGGEAETKTLQPGQSATLDADLGRAGKYTMYCPVGNHRQQGMEGTVTVTGGSSPSGDHPREQENERESEPETETGGGGGGYGY
jgi:plastocyanin